MKGRICRCGTERPCRKSHFALNSQHRPSLRPMAVRPLQSRLRAVAKAMPGSRASASTCPLPAGPSTINRFVLCLARGEHAMVCAAARGRVDPMNLPSPRSASPAVSSCHACIACRAKFHQARVAQILTRTERVLYPDAQTAQGPPGRVRSRAKFSGCEGVNPRGAVNGYFASCRCFSIEVCPTNFQPSSTKMTAAQQGQESVTPIILWCVPRSVSTATERAFMTREDTRVWHEPLGDPF